MRIVPYSNDDEIDSFPTMTVIIKSIPFEDSYVPACIINTSSEDYVITLDELTSLMDGIEIISNQIDQMINLLINPKIINPEDVPEGVFFEFGVYDEDEDSDKEDE